jgi:hypothetical protein
MYDRTTWAICSVLSSGTKAAAAASDPSVPNSRIVLLLIADAGKEMVALVCLS